MIFVGDALRSLFGEIRALLTDLTEHLIRVGASEEEILTARKATHGLDEAFLLVVVGEFNSGKSSFLNALLGADLLEEGVTPTTDRVTVIVAGEADRLSKDESDPFVVRRELPYGFLENVALVDTPGTNAVIRQHQTLTEGFLPRADLVLFLTSADRPFTESERVFLGLAHAWSRKIVLVVNKADLLERDEDREKVHEFVSRNAREMLGHDLPVFLISARLERRQAEEGGEEGFRALEAYLREILGNREQVRLKIRSPLGVAARLLAESQTRAEEAQRVLEDDRLALAEINARLDSHMISLSRDLANHLRLIDGVLDGIEKRGDLFFDEMLRLGRTFDLLKTSRVRSEFERQVIADVPEVLERRLQLVIDSFLERNIHFWDELLEFLATRHTMGARSRFHYDRQTLLASLGETARREIDQFDQKAFAQRLAQDAQGAVLQSGLISGVGIGLGGVMVAALSSLVADVTGILLSLTMLGLGLFVLPNRKVKAKRELRAGLGQLRSRLHEVLEREHRLEAERAAGRLRDATVPYTRFVQTEMERLERSSIEAERISKQISSLRVRGEEL